MNAEVSSSAPGWYPDPLGRFEHRYFNGQRWTADVSVDGGRYVDPSGATGATARPSKTMALVAFWCSLGGLALAWMPFLFVIGAGGAIAAVVLATIVLRRASSPPAAAGRPAGRGWAIAALAIAPLALGLSTVGFVLTRNVVREFVEYTDPGPNDAAITSCATDGPLLEVAGTVTNLDDRTHDYVVVVRVTEQQGDRVDELDLVRIEVDAVAPAEQRTWRGAGVGHTAAGAVRCEVFAVNGPFPFGLDPG